MYQWGYLKNAILAKLDLEIDESNDMGYTNRFMIYANEAMTQICSTVKPNRKFYELEIHNDVVDADGNVVTPSNLNTLITMPEDFISFGDDVNTVEYYDNFGNYWSHEVHDDMMKYIGYNQIICREIGKYYISYNARWLTFGDQDDNTYLNAPIDVLECIPSYVASQCMKVDDEYKSSVFRNEYEMLLARIDDVNFKSNKTLTIGGDW